MRPSATDPHASGPEPGAPRAGPLARVFQALGIGRAPAPSGAAPPRRVIIGLGNPGPEYADTRHNAGFFAADAAARQAGLPFVPARGPYVAAQGVWQGVPVAIVKPADVYMNHSGRAVRKVLADLGLGPDELLLVYDDLSLEPGQLRLRPKGGGGGHNGVQDVIDTLGTQNFPRLRIGVGSNFPRGRQVEYVLGPFPEAERPTMEAAFERAAEAALAFARDGLAAAMNRFNER